MTYKLTFANGAELDGLMMNGNTFISQTEVTDEDLNEDALKNVLVTESNGGTETLLYAGYDKIFHENDGWHFVLWGASPEEIRIRKQQERIQFLEDCLMEISEEVYK